MVLSFPPKLQRIGYFPNLCERKIVAYKFNRKDHTAQIRKLKKDEDCIYFWNAYMGCSELMHLLLQSNRLDTGLVVSYLTGKNLQEDSVNWVIN